VAIQNVLTVRRPPPGCLVAHSLHSLLLCKLLASRHCLAMRCLAVGEEICELLQEVMVFCEQARHLHAVITLADALLSLR
jgi:hypothetical protein